MSSGSAGWHSRLLLADIFGDQVDIKIRGNKKFQTFFGAFLGAAGVMLIAAYSILVVIDIVDISSPDVSAEDKYDYENHTFDISKTELLPLFTLIDRQTGQAFQHADLPNIFRPVAYFLDQSKFSQASGSGNGPAPLAGDGSDPAQAVAHIPGITLIIRWVPCLTLTNKDPYASIVNDQSKGSDSIKNAWCLEIPKNASLYKIRGGTFSRNSITFRLQFFPCITNNCYSSKVLDSVSVNMMSVKRYLQHSNFSQPIQKTPQFNNDIGLNTGLGSLYIYYLRTVKISSATNWFIGTSPDQEFSDIIKDNVFSTNRSSNYCLQMGTDCQPFFTMEYRSSGIVTTYKRKYTELLDATSNIGGLKELVMVIGVFIYGWYNQIFQQRYLSSAILDPEELRCLTAHKQDLKSTSDKGVPGESSQKLEPILPNDAADSPKISLAIPNTTNSKTPVSPAALLSPKSGNQMVRVRPKSPNHIARDIEANQQEEVAAVAISPPQIKGKSEQAKVVLRHLVDGEEESLAKKHQSAVPRLEGNPVGEEDPWVESLRLEADKLAEELISIETLLSELSTVRVLTNMMLSDHHKKLVPLVEIERRRRQTNTEHQQTENSNSEQMDISQAIKLLKVVHQASEPPKAAVEGSAETLKDMYRPLIDRYFSDALFKPREPSRPSSVTSFPENTNFGGIPDVKSPVASLPIKRIKIQSKRLSKAAIPTWPDGPTGTAAADTHKPE